jgi:hypothetical protein
VYAQKKREVVYEALRCPSVRTHNEAFRVLLSQGSNEPSRSRTLKSEDLTTRGRIRERSVKHGVAIAFWQ